MIPYDPKSPLVLWFGVWRKCVAYAKEGGPNADFYQTQAALSQMEYLCYAAQTLAGIKEEYK